MRMFCTPYEWGDKPLPMVLNMTDKPLPMKEKPKKKKKISKDRVRGSKR